MSLSEGYMHLLVHQSTSETLFGKTRHEYLGIKIFSDRPHTDRPFPAVTVVHEPNPPGLYHHPFVSFRSNSSKGNNPT